MQHSGEYLTLVLTNLTYGSLLEQLQETNTGWEHKSLDSGSPVAL